MGYPTQDGINKCHATYDAFMKIGWKRNPAIGAIVNGLQESNLNPSAVSGDDGGGIWQWTPWYPSPAYPGVTSATEAGAVLGDFNNQVQFLTNDPLGKWGINPIHPEAPYRLDSIKTYSQVGEDEVWCTIDFLIQFERPAEINLINRRNSAAADAALVLEMLGNPANNGGSGGGTTPTPTPEVDTNPERFFSLFMNTPNKWLF